MMLEREITLQLGYEVAKHCQARGAVDSIFPRCTMVAAALRLRGKSEQQGEWQEWPYHVESSDILKRDLPSGVNQLDLRGFTSAYQTYLAGLVPLYEELVNAERAGSGRKTEHEGMLGSRRKVLDPFNDVVGDIGTSGARVVSDDEPHDDWIRAEQGVVYGGGYQEGIEKGEETGREGLGTPG